MSTENGISGQELITRKCEICGQRKPASQFGNRVPGQQPRCRTCKRKGWLPPRYLEPPKRPEEPAGRWPMRWPVTRHQRRLLAERFGTRCGICNELVPLHVDHDHTTGFVRGLLCQPCNFAIGAFRDQPALLAKAAAYLANPPALTPMRWPTVPERLVEPVPHGPAH